ncbi:MAG: fatty acid desaturase [Sphingobacteriales bacterium]|nr:fatty acid desaturase [Sphingobacteriales bacterium]
MKNNLEGISFEQVVNKAGTSYAVFRGQLTPRYSLVFFDIARGYFFLFLISALVIVLHRVYSLPWWLLIPAGGLLTGYCAAYIALFAHEASHYNIHPDKKTNDRLATVFLCLPFGLSLKSYRKIHWQHHLYLGTPSDTEISYFNHLSGLFILETLTGIHLLRTILTKEKIEVLSQEQKRESRTMLLAGFVLHAVLLAAAFLTGNWVTALAWILGFGIFFPFFATIRQLLEHRDELARATSDFRRTPHGKLSRIFCHTLLSSSFGAAGFTRHMIHHWDPQASYTRMKEIEDFLHEDEKTAAIIRASKTTYSTVFKTLLKAR